MWSDALSNRRSDHRETMTLQQRGHSSNKFRTLDTPEEREPACKRVLQAGSLSSGVSSAFTVADRGP